MKEKAWESPFSDGNYRALRANGVDHQTIDDIKAVFHPPRWPPALDDGKTVILPDVIEEPENLKAFLKAYRLVRVNSHFLPYNSFVIRFRDPVHAVRFRLFWPGETELPKTKVS